MDPETIGLLEGKAQRLVDAQLGASAGDDRMQIPALDGRAFEDSRPSRS
jgi:hypothetical protein